MSRLPELDGERIDRRRELRFSFDGKELKRTGAIQVSGGPAGIRTAER